MALSWEYSWKEVIVEYHGSRMKALRDEKTGLLACPICGLKDKSTFFYTARDLFNHVIAHVEEKWRRIKVEVVEEEEKEEIGEEEEE